MSTSYIKGQITVCIPVYNEEQFLEQLLDSIVGQADKIIISDNASTDRTEEICRKYATRYPHVRYYRQASNIGMAGNVISIYQKLDTEFFCFIGGHDYVARNYFATLKAILLANPESALAYSMTHNVDYQNNILGLSGQEAIRDRARSDNPFYRAFVMGTYSGDCSLANGVFRTEMAIQACLELGSYAGVDREILFEVALNGKFIYTNATVYSRRIRPKDSTADYIKRITGDENAVVTRRDYRPMAKDMKKSLWDFRGGTLFGKVVWYPIICTGINETFFRAKEARVLLNALIFAKMLFRPSTYWNPKKRQFFFQGISRVTGHFFRKLVWPITAPLDWINRKIFGGLTAEIRETHGIVALAATRVNRSNSKIQALIEQNDELLKTTAPAVQKTAPSAKPVKR